MRLSEDLLRQCEMEVGSTTEEIQRSAKRPKLGKMTAANRMVGTKPYYHVLLL